MTASVIVETADGVAVVSLNRPGALNALDEPMAGLLADSIEALRGDESVRAVLLRGEGRGFCAGGDVSTFGSDLGALDRLLVGLHRAASALRSFPAPVIAQLHGAVAGAGLSLSLACDFAIAADNCKFTLAYSKLGVTPDGGATWSLPRIVGVRKALQMACLPELFGAEEALRLGLVNRVVPALAIREQGEAYARSLAEGPTAVFGRIKALIYASSAVAFGEHLDAERKAFLASAASPDFTEGREAFLAKRPSLFRGK